MNGDERQTDRPMDRLIHPNLYLYIHHPHLTTLPSNIFLLSISTASNFLVLFHTASCCLYLYFPIPPSFPPPPRLRHRRRSPCSGRSRRRCGRATCVRRLRAPASPAAPASPTARTRRRSPTCGRRRRRRPRARSGRRSRTGRSPSGGRQ